MEIRKIIKKCLVETADINQWMSGECIPFAVALKKVFPHYGIAVLNDLVNDVDEDIEYNYNFVHAFCYCPENHTIIIDAKGVRKLNNLYDDFHDINPEIDWDIYSSEQLIEKYSNKEFYSEESFPFDVEEYKSALSYIKNNIDKYSVE